MVLPTRIQEKVSTNAAYFLKAGAKVGLYNIQAKYIRGFFRVFLKHFYKTLIDKCVEEHIFLRRMESLAKGTHYNICACARKETTEG